MNTPFPPYHGTRMITKLAAPGDTLVRAVGSTPIISAHAVRRAGGDLSVMLINKDPGTATSQTVPAYSIVVVQPHR